MILIDFDSISAMIFFRFKIVCLDSLKLVGHKPYILYALYILGKFSSFLPISCMFPPHFWMCRMVEVFVLFIVMDFSPLHLQFCPEKCILFSILYNVSFCPISDMWICGLKRT